MLSRRVVVTAGAVLLFAAAWPSRSQAQDDTWADHTGFVLRLQGGGYSPLAHLDDSDLVDFKTGFNLGGGAAYQINRYVAVRANFTWARAEGRDQTASLLSGIAGMKFNRFLYDGDVQLRYPFRSGVAPYVFAGGGGITTRRPEAFTATTFRDRSFTKGAGKLGLGVSYQLPASGVGVYAEGATWVYKWDRLGFNKTQYDTAWSGGISYRF